MTIMKISIIMRTVSKAVKNMNISIQIAPSRYSQNTSKNIRKTTNSYNWQRTIENKHH